MSVVINNLTVDCRDPKALAEFWTAALGWQIVDESEDGVMIAPFAEPHPGVFPVYFAGEPRRQGREEPLALRPRAGRPGGRGRPAPVARALAAPTSARETSPWVVLADLEGNEFCVLRSLPREEAV